MRAVIHLKKSDPIMARIIEEIGPCRYETKNFGTHFDALCRSIVYQQLSTKAASTIHGRTIPVVTIHASSAACTSIEVWVM